MNTTLTTMTASRAGGRTAYEDRALRFASNKLVTRPLYLLALVWLLWRLPRLSTPDILRWMHLHRVRPEVAEPTFKFEIGLVRHILDQKKKRGTAGFQTS
jgi:hypothetical protein